MPIPYLTFIKHAEKVTKNAPGTLPITKGVHHKDGYVEVTDGFRFYRAKSNYSISAEGVIDLATGRQLEGKYPNMGSFVPTAEPPVVVVLDVAHTLDATKALQQVGTVAPAPGERKTKKEDVILSLETIESLALLSTPINKARAEYTLPVESSKSNLTTAFNSNYIIQALELFKDVGIDTITWEIYEELRPCKMYFDDNLMVVLLPVKLKKVNKKEAVTSV